LLRYIVREFKTRLYESFLRQQAGIRSLGQFFTPRNVVQAVVQMSEAGSLREGDSLCDPFCGVGGFLLEAIVENENLLFCGTDFAIFASINRGASWSKINNNLPTVAVHGTSRGSAATRRPPRSATRIGRAR
jgi:hypothetical protein